MVSLWIHLIKVILKDSVHNRFYEDSVSKRYIFKGSLSTKVLEGKYITSKNIYVTKSLENVVSKYTR